MQHHRCEEDLPCSHSRDSGFFREWVEEAGDRGRGQAGKGAWLLPRGSGFTQSPSGTRIPWQLCVVVKSWDARI